MPFSCVPNDIFFSSSTSTFLGKDEMGLKTNQPQRVVQSHWVFYPQAHFGKDESCELAKVKTQSLWGISLPAVAMGIGKDPWWCFLFVLFCF